MLAALRSSLFGTDPSTGEQSGLFDFGFGSNDESPADQFASLSRSFSFESSSLARMRSGNGAPSGARMQPEATYWRCWPCKSTTPKPVMREPGSMPSTRRTG